MIRQAVILCGGKGTRLGELTKDTPKPLLDVGDWSFIEHLMQEVSRYGFEEIVLLAGHMGTDFWVYQGATFNHAKIKVIIEDRPRGTWGGVVDAKEHLDDYFVLMNGDSWLDIDMTRLRSMKPNGIHMIGRYVADAERYETLDINKTNVKRIIPRGEAKNGFINSGVYVVEKTCVDIIHSEHPISLENMLLPTLADTGALTVETVSSNTYFIDIGIPEDYERAQTEVPEHRTRPALFVDRDNCLTYDRDGYTHHPDDMEFKPGAIELIKLANIAGWYVFVVTNQGGVTKGKYEEHYILDFHRKMQYTLNRYNAHLDGLDYEIELDSWRRKPNPGMIEEFMSDWFIDKEMSFMIGDKLSDKQAGEAAGIRGFQIDDQGDIYDQFGDYIVRK